MAARRTVPIGAAQPRRQGEVSQLPGQRNETAWGCGAMPAGARSWGTRRDRRRPWTGPRSSPSRHLRTHRPSRPPASSAARPSPTMGSGPASLSSRWRLDRLASPRGLRHLWLCHQRREDGRVRTRGQRAGRARRGRLHLHPRAPDPPRVGRPRWRRRRHHPSRRSWCHRLQRRGTGPGNMTEVWPCG